MVAGLIVLCGPTASGKTRLALDLATRLNTIILSADSRQVYRELNIGTAKPTAAELALIPHDLIDICEPTETLTLADYQSQAQAILAQRDDIPLLVGGTGLYIKAIAQGLKIPRVPPQTELRAQLQTLGQGHCYPLLQQVDPLASAKIHPNDSTRTIRALEVFYVTGRRMSAQQGECPPPYPVLYLGLDGDRLKARIAQRVEAMIAAGLVAEVQGLGDRYGFDLPLLKTLGYGEICQYLQGAIALETTKDLIIRHTAQFAKRQRTWFRANPHIHWFDMEAENLVAQAWETVEAWRSQHHLSKW
ncbi:tRNA (adenosine(37)-N6)-dimethylallyltransferase MiaA [Spirulina sp. CCNP1310]|uniref:tRNA (adenosine(37)-N6)-dimethylallyltransferase MiaA n=1 Tax=Spirulina sp. CCNP1310 TaxID=3110249 RepID=UPI002B21EFCF|nr:tRNA (adenosine(37)-N6)-dimethylallyltransferase MiaA [Spirulina sp. CCNP1310]MEA5420760.1 tRNA (adenosine(37)-N6)-dimethylallyltransferase MiaA [Spirulina sp. CCNP1310]